MTKLWLRGDGSFPACEDLSRLGSSASQRGLCDSIYTPCCPDTPIPQTLYLFIRTTGGCNCWPGRDTDPIILTDVNNVGFWYYDDPDFSPCEEPASYEGVRYYFYCDGSDYLLGIYFLPLEYEDDPGCFNNFAPTFPGWTTTSCDPFFQYFEACSVPSSCCPPDTDVHIEVMICTSPTPCWPTPLYAIYYDASNEEECECRAYNCTGSIVGDPRVAWTDELFLSMEDCEDRLAEGDLTLPESCQLPVPENCCRDIDPYPTLYVTLTSSEGASCPYHDVTIELIDGVGSQLITVGDCEYTINLAYGCTIDGTWALDIGIDHALTNGEECCTDDALDQEIFTLTDCDPFTYGTSYSFDISDSECCGSTLSVSVSSTPP